MKKLFILLTFCLSSMIGKAIPADVFTALDTVILDVYAQVQNNRDSSKMVINTLRLFDVIQNTPDSLRDEELLRDAIILLCFEFVDGVYVPNTLILYMAGKDQPKIVVFDLSAKLQIANTPSFYVDTLDANILCIDVMDPVYGFQCVLPTPTTNGIKAKVARTIQGKHSGWDIFRFNGAPVVAIMSGTIVKRNYSKLAGNQMWILHSQTNLISKYFHFEKFAKDLKVGDFVEAGTVIGYEGNSGHVYSNTGGDGTHLHFELLYVWNPIPYGIDFKLTNLKTSLISPGCMFDFGEEKVKGPLYFKRVGNFITEIKSSPVQKKKKVVVQTKPPKVIENEKVSYIGSFRGTVSP